MNKIYKIVWNAAQQAWVVVSELARGHVKASATSTASNEALSQNGALPLGKLGSGTLIGSVAVTLLTLSSTVQADDTVTAAKNGTISSGGLIAVGDGTQAFGQGAIAIGNNSYAAPKSIAIGENNTVAGCQSTVIGRNVKTLSTQTDQIALAHNLNLSCASTSSNSTYIGHNITASASSGASWTFSCSTLIGNNMNFVVNQSSVSGLTRSSVIGNNINYNSYRDSYATMVGENLTFKGDYLRDSSVIGRNLNITAYNSTGWGTTKGYSGVNHLNLLGSCVTLNSDSLIGSVVAS